MTSLTSPWLLAAGLGLAALLVLWLTRGLNQTHARRVRAAGLPPLLALAAYLILVGLGYPADNLALRISLALAILLGANAVLQLFDWLFWEYGLGQRRHITIPRLVVDVFNFVVLAGVAILVLNRIFGVQDLSALLVTSTVLSAVVGLAVQDTLGNVVAGLALQVEHPVTVGDWVKVSGEEGQVVQMNWRTMTLRTRDQHVVLLPNGNVARDLIINFSRPTSLQRMHASVGVAYGHPPGQVKEVLAQAVASAAGVAGEPAPEALVHSYGDFAVQYDLLYWITDFARAPQIHDEVLTRLWYALHRHGLTIPFPARDVTVRMLADDHLAQARAQQQRDVFAELRRITLFRPLADPVIEQLARGAVLQRYTSGETLVRQGEAGDSLFVIKSGRVRVDVRGDGGANTTLNRLGPDDFFGELSLLTGEPRSASVIAETETEVVLVDKADLAPVIAADARLPEVITEVLAARQRQLADQLTAAGAKDIRPASPPAALLSRIRRFFGVG